MRNTTKFLFIALTFVLCQNVYSQSDAKRYIRIIVSDVNTSIDQKQVDDLMRSKPGVITSRMDRRTKCYFAVYQENAGISPYDFKSWISDLGFTPSCHVSGIHGNGDLIKPLSLESCNEKTGQTGK